MIAQLPSQLHDDLFKFVKLNVPVGTDVDKQPIAGILWSEHLGSWQDAEKWLAAGHNVAIVCGHGGLVVFDVDAKNEGEKATIAERVSLVRENLGDTFIVKTGTGGFHFYIKTGYTSAKAYAPMPNKGGEVRVHDCYVLVPPSVHPNGNQYEVCRDMPILNAPDNRIDELVKKLGIDTTEAEPAVAKSPDVEFEEVDKKFIEKDILPRLSPNTQEMIRTGNFNSNEYPSRSERDEAVLVQLISYGFAKYAKSVFKLYPVGQKYIERPEQTGGDAYLKHQIAAARTFTGTIDDRIPMLENEILKMHQRTLRNRMDEVLMKLMELNQKDWNFIIKAVADRASIKDRAVWHRFFDLKKMKEMAGQKPISASELLKQEEPILKYRVTNFIVEPGINVIGGRPEGGKSLLMLMMGMSIARGRSLMGNFGTKKSKVLMYDLENGLDETHRRMRFLMDDVDAERDDLADLHIIETFNKLDLKAELDRAKEYDVIMVDSFRRILAGDENSSEAVNNIYTDFLRPLKTAGKCVIIIHHFRKARPEELSNEDLQDMFRGSSDFIGALDAAYTLFKQHEKVKDGILSYEVAVYKAKNRSGIPFRNFAFSVRKEDIIKHTQVAYLGERRFETPEMQRINRLVEMLQDGELRKKQIMDNFPEFSTATVSRILEAAVARDVVTRDKKGTYRLFKDEETEQETLAGEKNDA